MNILLVCSNSPYTVAQNPIYTDWLRATTGKTIYDLTDKAFPESVSVPYVFQFSNGVNDLKTCYVNENVIATVLGPSGQFQVYASAGATVGVHVTGANGDSSPVYKFNAYNLHALIALSSSFLLAYRKQIDQLRADTFASSGNVTDVTGAVLDPDPKAVRAYFGEMVDAYRVQGESDASYLHKVNEMIDAYSLGGVRQSVFDVIGGYASGQADIYTSLDRKEFNAGFEAKVRRKLVPGTSGVVEWFPATIVVDQDKLHLGYGSLTLTGQATVFLYVDGSKDSINNLAVKTSATEPPYTLVGYVEQIAPSGILTDVSGIVTGFINNRYIALRRYASLLTSISSTGTNQPTGAKIISKTNLVDLRCLASSGAIGTITIGYNVLTRPVVLAKVGLTGNVIYYIQGSGRPSAGGLGQTIEAEFSNYEIYVNDNSLTNEAKATLYRSLKELVPVGRKGFLFFKNSSVVGQFYVYHRDNYEFFGVL